jgi:uncharacterized protein (DUF2062 family)
MLAVGTACFVVTKLGVDEKDESILATILVTALYMNIILSTLWCLLLMAPLGMPGVYDTYRRGEGSVVRARDRTAIKSASEVSG